MQIGLWRPVQRRRRHILVLRLDPVCLEADLIWSKMYPGLIKYPPNSTIGNIQLGFHKCCHHVLWLLMVNLLQIRIKELFARKFMQTSQLAESSNSFIQFHLSIFSRSFGRVGVKLPTIAVSKQRSSA